VHRSFTKKSEDRDFPDSEFVRHIVHMNYI
jgi:hypothetical protein